MSRPLPITVSLISLGCPKNTVDSERLLALLVSRGFLLAERPDDSDICLVNTCGFIADARKEAAQTLNALKKMKRRKRHSLLCVAMGCLVEHGRRPGLDVFLREADLCVPFRDYLRLPEVLTAAWEKARNTPEAHSERKRLSGTSTKMDPAFHAVPRVITGSGHSVALKISEGCSNGCSFCAIPSIRGGQADRPEEDILRELGDLVAAGVREVSIIAQDTSAYGMQRYGERRLAPLLKKMAETVREDIWFRLMYVYPGHLDDEVLRVMAKDPRFCPYIDMPLQHISNRILKAMRRRCSRADIERLLDRIRTFLPGVALRTAFITGYPGETVKEFEELLVFVQRQGFDHMGVFSFSSEPATLAGRKNDDVPKAEKERRREVLMAAQQALSAKKLSGLVGCDLEVMVDGPRLVEDESGREVEVLAARTPQQAPEIDGLVILKQRTGRAMPAPGTRCRAKITGSASYDLFGRIR